MKYLKLFEEGSTHEPDIIRLARLGLAQVKVLSWHIADSREYPVWNSPGGNTVKEIRYLLYPEWPKSHDDYEDLIAHSDYETLIKGYDPADDSDVEIVHQMVHRTARYWEADWIYDSKNTTWEKPSKQME
jgi:hypothetical protein